MQQSCVHTFRLENQALLVSSLRTCPHQNLAWVKKKEKRPCLCSVYGCISAGHCHSAERRTWLGCEGGSQGDGRHHRTTGTKTDPPQSHWYVISNGCRKFIKSMSMVGSLNLGQLICFELSFKYHLPPTPYTDSEFVESFLLTFSSFMSPLELMNALVAR